VSLKILNSVNFFGSTKNIVYSILPNKSAWSSSGGRQDEIQLQAQHHTGEKADQQHNLSGFGADKIDLFDDFLYLLDPKYHDKGPEEKYAHGPQIGVQPECFAAEEIKKGFHGSFRWAQCYTPGGIFNRGIICRLVVAPSFKTIEE